MARACVWLFVLLLALPAVRLRRPTFPTSLDAVTSPVARAQARASDLDPRVTGLLSSVSEERLAATLRKLESFKTRNTLSSIDPQDNEIGAARQWIFDELKRAGSRLQVSFDAYAIPKQGDRITRDVEVLNVMAVLPGRSARRIYVSGHYDSYSSADQQGSNPLSSVPPRETAAAGPDQSRASDTRAPGVNDDGSGTAVTMELARVFAESGVNFDATIVFIAFAGEEQNLVGARLHAHNAEVGGVIIDAVLNNDIVGGAVGGNGVVDSESVRVFAEGPEDSLSRQLARYIRRAAARYLPGHVVRLIPMHDRFARGGDHTAFNEHGFAAVRITESNENYARQHSAADTFEGISVPYLAQNARVNAATLASLALAPAAPTLVPDRRNRRLPERAPSRYDATLRWNASPGATGYTVVWRDAAATDWQHELTVATATHATFSNLSIDDYLFGVAATGDGHESLVRAWVNPTPSKTEITVR
ncbi:MAG: M20/M25/M40 family metallo-hydrolase [Acidobacteria bacterium]|nr:M20/M25/M40 family metallo-hydrolase [Acidobacteriota bacterium]